MAFKKVLYYILARNATKNCIVALLMSYCRVQLFDIEGAYRKDENHLIHFHYGFL
jgi:hypothetical protein